MTGRKVPGGALPRNNSIPACLDMSPATGKTFLIVAAILMAVVLAVIYSACGGPQPTPAKATPVDVPAPTATATPTPTPTATQPPQLQPTHTPTPTLSPDVSKRVPEINVTSEVVASAQLPVALAFAPDGRLFFNDLLTDTIQTVDVSTDQPHTFAKLDVFRIGECGMIGLAIDPEFSENHYVYVYLAEPIQGRDDIGHPVVMRFTAVGNRGRDPTVLIGDLPNTNPKACSHLGGHLHFGPDGYLYVSMGELELKDPAQDLGSPLGKILRVDKGDGSAAPDNPFVDMPGADPRVFAYGLRNPYDFSFHPQSGQIYEAENGPSNCDEINIIMPGENYGHPMSYSDAEEPPCLERPGATPIYLPHRPGMRPEVFGSNVAPTGIHFVSGDVYPSIGDALLYCEWNTGFMRRLVLAGPGQDRVVDDSVVVEDCHLDITTDSEGIVYYSSFWEIRRLVPSSEEKQ